MDASLMRCTQRATLAVTAAVAFGVLGAPALVASAAPSPTPSASQSAPVASDASKSRVTFGVQPATARSRDARPALVYGATAGASLRDHVAVLNYSSKPVVLRVYAADALNTDTGGFGLQPAAAKK